MIKIFYIFLISLFSYAASDSDLKPGEWLLSKPILLSFTDNEKKQFDKCKTAKEEAEVFKKFHKRIFNNISDKFIAKPGNKIITTYGTTQWEKVESVGESPAFPEDFPEYSLVFAAKYWISPEEQEAEFKFGIDDATEIRHNGNKIYKPLHGGAYKADKFVVPVTLKKGTNKFVFSAINYIGPGMLGTRLYPKKTAIYPGLFLETKNPLETKEIIEINFYWKPSSIIKPRKKVYKNCPKCEKLEISDLAKNVVTQISGGNLDFPIKINMTGKENGIYKIKSEYLSQKHRRYFFFGKNLTPTEEWKCEILKQNDFCSPDALWNQIFVKNKTGAKRIHAYKSKYDDTIQPYVVMLPANEKFKEGLPLIVVLRPYILTDKIEFIRKQRERRFNTLNAIMLWPHSRGCNGFKGLSEKDVLEVIYLVCKEYKIDRDRIFLSGDSFGAYGCWKIAGRYPDLFAGIQAFDGCELKYPDNLINVPIWQLRVKPHPPGYNLLNTIAHLNENGKEAKFTDLRALEGNLRENYLNAKKSEKWFLNKKRNLQPDKVSYSTFGDIDGAYWVRNILPERFGKMATVVAEIEVISNQLEEGVGCQVSGVRENELPKLPTKNADSNLRLQQTNTIHVWTENVSSFSLDLRKGRFLTFRNWNIVINGSIETNATSRKMFSYECFPQATAKSVAASEQNELVDNEPPRAKAHPSFLRRGTLAKKRNGFCGGIADVVNNSFLFAYSANDLKARMRAENEDHLTLIGMKFNGKTNIKGIVVLIAPTITVINQQIILAKMRTNFIKTKQNLKNRNGKESAG